MTGILLLAAGESSRLGSPKQLLPWRGQTLLRHTATTALEAAIGPVTVVLGAVHEPCVATLEGLPLRIVHHAGWAEGMGGSIAAGMKSVQEDGVTAVIVLLCDQPFIDAGILRHLDATGRHGATPVVASRFAGADGPPVWFAASRFPKLLGLSGHQGAKPLLREDSMLVSIDCPQAGTDIDTPDDWRNLENASRR